MFSFYASPPPAARTVVPTCTKSEPLGTATLNWILRRCFQKMSRASFTVCTLRLTAHQRPHCLAEVGRFMYSS